VGDAVRHGGVVFMAGEHLAFLPATVALKVIPMPEVARVPGAPRELAGVALVDGETIPVVRVLGGTAPASGGALLVITFLGERIGLSGVEVLATGRFESMAESAHGENVVHEGRVARLFDVAALVSKVREGRWAV
jgi:hypothetical protein